LFGDGEIVGGVVLAGSSAEEGDDAHDPPAGCEWHQHRGSWTQLLEHGEVFRAAGECHEVGGLNYREEDRTLRADRVAHGVAILPAVPPNVSETLCSVTERIILDGKADASERGQGLNDIDKADIGEAGDCERGDVGERFFGIEGLAQLGACIGEELERIVGAAKAHFVLARLGVEASVIDCERGAAGDVLGEVEVARPVDAAASLGGKADCADGAPMGKHGDRDTGPHIELAEQGEVLLIVSVGLKHLIGECGYEERAALADDAGDGLVAVDGGSGVRFEAVEKLLADGVAMRCGRTRKFAAFAEERDRAPIGEARYHGRSDSLEGGIAIERGGELNADIGEELQ
jgi:hypothetical protein